ncbi:hypothetical protein C7S20_05650 [Christiangramia fulva]|uniref:Uncharacterized protein n=1 Tax=Christiangramia fulva TaxID=2126553 RepID=A0A2R3Z3K0_9FLAO|nr:hypothetical protein [Christiangramia fulva]AVR44792.1 hypothetical protein C7S20_05650 [Christiangramia fulva]
MKYEDYKDFTVEDYRKMQMAQDDFVGMLLYQYVVVKIELKRDRTIYKKSIHHILHHDIEVAREEALRLYDEEVAKLQELYSPTLEEYDPDLGTGHHIGLALGKCADMNKIIGIRASIDDWPVQLEEEQEIFEELKKLNLDSPFVDNVIKPEDLAERIGNASVPNKKGRHMLKFPGGIHMIINVS